MIKFYADTHIAKTIAVQLRQQGIDIIRCEEVGMASASDLEHLEYATRESRVVITHDDDFLTLDKEWKSQGKAHAGIMYCLQHLQGSAGIGRIIQECVDLHELIEAGAGTLAEDVNDQIIYVS